MKPVWIVVVAACGLLAGSCATLSEDQCQTGDWAGIGYSDGANGHGTGRFGDHVKACEQFGVVPDQAVYMTGRARGLTVYCQPGRGFQVGRSGNSYGGVCPASLEGPFLGGYSDGRIVWETQQRYDRAQSAINAATSRSDDIERRMREAEAMIADPAVSDDEKKALRERLKALRDDRYSAGEDRRQAIDLRDQADRDLSRLRARFGPVYGGW
ncbi:MAG: DUF2799 domain-containing protein [Caulobacter sp.]|nr:DUF2799 domain-containing protein [Caulobacter sp.]